MSLEEMAELAKAEQEYGDDFDVISLMNASVDDDLGVIKDLTIDDRDLPRAKNFLDFAYNFQGKNTRRPFIRQMWLALRTFTEICPGCSSPKYFNDMTAFPVDRPAEDVCEHLVLFENGVCPKCKRGKSDYIRAGKLSLVTELLMLAGQRSGKSTTTSFMSSYLTHQYLKMPPLHTFCKGIDQITPIVGHFVGQRTSDAIALLWNPIKKSIDASPWFKDYHQLLDSYGEKYGKELYKVRDLFIKYSHKNIDLFPSNATKRGLRGRTRFQGAIDELGWFPINTDYKPGQEDMDDDRERADGAGTYDALDRSLFTIRNETRRLVEQGVNTMIPGINFLISSPSHSKDMMSRLYASKAHVATTLRVHAASWEINPLISKNSPDIQSAYETNPITAARDFEAIVPVAEGNFMAESAPVLACFVGQNRASVAQIDATKDGVKWRSGNLTSHPPNSMPPSILAIDAGYSKNSFALAIGYREGLKLNVPVLTEIFPTLDRKLHYNSIYKRIIEPLLLSFNVKWVFADRWQSLAMLHRIQDEKGIHADVFSVKRACFDLTRSLAEGTDFILPKLEEKLDRVKADVNYPTWFKDRPAAHLLFQMTTVLDLGNTVVKGHGYTDDLFRALVLLASRWFDEKVYAEMQTFVAKQRASNPLGTMRGIGSQNYMSLHGRPTTVMTAPILGGYARRR